MGIAVNCHTPSAECMRICEKDEFVEIKPSTIIFVFYKTQMKTTMYEMLSKLASISLSPSAFIIIFPGLVHAILKMCVSTFFGVLLISGVKRLGPPLIIVPYSRLSFS